MRKQCISIEINENLISLMIDNQKHAFNSSKVYNRLIKFCRYILSELILLVEDYNNSFWSIHYECLKEWTSNKRFIFKYNRVD